MTDNLEGDRRVAQEYAERFGAIMTTDREHRAADKFSINKIRQEPVNTDRERVLAEIAKLTPKQKEVAEAMAQIIELNFCARTRRCGTKTKSSGSKSERIKMQNERLG